MSHDGSIYTTDIGQTLQIRVSASQDNQFLNIYQHMIDYGNHNFCTLTE